MQARALGDLLADSAYLSRDGIAPFAAIAAAGLLPGFLVVMAALAVTGFTSQESVRAAVSEGELLRVGLLLAAGLLRQLVNAVAFVALVVAVAARDAGERLGPGEAYARAKDRFVPFLLTELRALLYIAGGLLLLVVPGIVLAARYCLVHLAVILEGRAGKAALQRSAELVASRAGKVLGNLLAAAALAAGGAYLANALLSLVFTAFWAMLPGVPSFLERQTLALIGELTGGLAWIWLASFSVLLYKDLASEAAHAQA